MSELIRIKLLAKCIFDDIDTCSQSGRFNKAMRLDRVDGTRLLARTRNFGKLGHLYIDVFTLQSFFNQSFPSDLSVPLFNS